MPAEVSTADIARFLNLTQNQLRNLEHNGIITRAGHNQWDPTKCAAAYIRWLQKEVDETKNSEVMANDKVLTQSQAAAILGVSARRLRQRDQEDNPPPKNSEGQYPCEAFGRWLKSDLSRGLGVADDGSVYVYEVERGRLTHHQANAAALEEGRKKRELIHVDMIRSFWSNVLAIVRSKLLSLPSRIASVCAGKTSEEIEAEAQAIIYEALGELSKGGDGVPSDTD
ncbi:MAG: hypothetical protein HGB02_08680 [Chlorobiaceae bacterium]|nr:hypothetical protein [Chlorobiaceae bacterium]